MRYIPCNCDMFILANSNSVMDTTLYIPRLYKTLKTVVAFSSWTLRWSMRFVHGGCIAAAGSSLMPARSIAKRKEKKDVWYWQISPILIYFACIISSCHDISSSHCSQLQRDAIFDACMIHDAPTQTNRKYPSICQIRLLILIDATFQINLAWHTVRGGG